MKQLPIFQPQGEATDPNRLARRALRSLLRKASTNGVVIYEGPSQIDGAPIVVIATGLIRASNNEKTGAMVQTWILRSDMEPLEASDAGEDASICGDCPHRWNKGGACYVRIGDAPTSVYRAWKRGKYPTATPTMLATIGDGWRVRAGSYGDPAAVPLYVWALLRPSTGYTHQWRDPRFAALAAVCMASCDSPAEREEARANGWRTFRVGPEGSTPQPGEIFCVNTTHGTSCHDCGLCLGGVPAADILIEVHGARRATAAVV